MILRLYPEELRMQLNKGLCPAYLLLGNDPLLLQESQDTVRQIAATYGFNEHYTVQINHSHDWQEIFSRCQTTSLFTSRQTLTLVLPENGLNQKINDQLSKLVKLLHSDLLLLIRGNKLTQAQENSPWFTHLAAQAVLVTCQTPKQEQLPKWVKKRARQHNLQLDESACQLLCYHYESNLLALAQALDRFSLLWPDKKLTLARVQRAVHNSANFTPFHWIDALLVAKSKRALHILHQLRLEGSEPVTLLRRLQRELLLLIILKRHSATTPLHVLFDKHYVWQNRRSIITEAINRLRHSQLHQAVRLLTQAELTLQQDYTQSVWTKLETLSLLLCQNKALSNIFIDG